MFNWKNVKKIDAHIHLLPDDVHKANSDSDDIWTYAKIDEYVKIMEEYNIEKALIMPLNDPWLMSMQFNVEAVHRNLNAMQKRFPGKFAALADIDIRNTPSETVDEILKVIEMYSFKGIKIHPNNSGINLDDEYNSEIFIAAEKKNIPVVIHSYPNSIQDPCSADRIIKALNKYPRLKLIIAHMGGMQWKKLLPTSVKVDFSAILPEYVEKFGIEKTNSILRKFGTDRLIFGTDFPSSRCLEPEAIYQTYFDILNKMDFSEEEVKKIAYTNPKNIYFKN